MRRLALLSLGFFSAINLPAQQPAPRRPAPARPEAPKPAPVPAPLLFHPEPPLPMELDFHLLAPDFRYEELAWSLRDMEPAFDHWRAFEFEPAFDTWTHAFDTWVELPEPGPHPDLDAVAAQAPFAFQRLPRPNLPEPSAFGGQDSPGDSLYRAARQILNRGEYRRAAELLQSFEQRFPRSRYVPSAMYWQAFALYRVGSDADLRNAFAVLERQRERYPEAAKENEVAALYTRVAGALAARGDARAAAAIRAGAAQAALSCDREEESVRAEALSALVQADPDGARELLRRTLARRDECSSGLRRRAVYLLARSNTPGVTAELLTAARGDPDADVRREAISHLGRREGDDATRALIELFNADLDQRTQSAILNALARRGTEPAHQFLRRAIEQETVAEAVRAAALRSLYSASARQALVATEVRRAVEARGDLSGVTVRGAAPVGGVTVSTRRTEGLSEADAEYLRTLYGRTSSRSLKTTVLDLLAGATDRATDAWILQLIRNPNEEMRYRSAAIRNLRRAQTPVADLGALYDALAERDLRSTIISVLGQREEDAATDKLIAIARSGTDPYLRRQAISALTRKKDPRTNRLLLELVEP